MRRILLLTALVSLMSNLGVSQVHPILERGFTPETSYEIGEIDAINLFNGALTLTIPIGQRYPVGGQLSYGLTLVYNSALWDYLIVPNNPPHDCGDYDDCTAVAAEPSTSSNAGLGWRLSLGELYDPGTWPNTGGGTWMYVAPDGARHMLYPTLHEGETPDDDVWYSRDNTYLRLTETAFEMTENGIETIEAVLEAPDGTKTTFAAGHYSNRFVPERIEDRFQNLVDITYPADINGVVEEWVLTDSQNRVQRIFWTTVANDQVVDKVELTAFGASISAVYQFVYDSAPGGTSIEETCKDREYPFGSTVVPLLTEVQRPDGTSFKMRDAAGSPGYYSDNIGDTLDCEVPYSGILKRLVLPTGGVYEWDFGRYRYPAGSGSTGCRWGFSDILQTAMTSSAGVVERRIISAPGRTAVWAYEREDSVDPSVQTVLTTVTAPDQNERVHYFRTQACRYDSGGSGYDAWSGWDYGLPFTRDSGNGNNRFRSADFYEGSAATGTLMRTQYVSYQHDQLPPISSIFGWYDTNRRVSGSSTVFEDDKIGGIPQLTTSSFSDFDGLGHFRVTARDGFGAGARTEVTNFNPDRGEYSINSSTNIYTGDFVLPDSSDPWIIGTYDATSQSAGGDAAAQEYCFDPDNGALLHTRILTDGTSRSADDILKVLAYDTSGNMTSESLFGGDVQAVLDTNGLTPICDLMPPGVPEYKLIHTYQNGALATSKYDSDDEEILTGDEFFTTDRTIDANTGLPSKSRDVSGFETVFTYDAMGRVNEVAPDEGARVEVTYTAATNDVSKTGYAPAIVDIEYWDSLDSKVAAEAFEYDGLGRVTSQQRKMPDGTWSERLTEYTAVGWTYRVSEFDANGTESPNWKTYSAFDPFGRAGLVTRPDGKTTSFAYLGERAATQTVSIATTTTTETEFETTTISDHLGRVTQVQEPLSVTSNYQYDVGGRLEQVYLVTPGGTQTRTFDYDNRGFLASETMPEKGASGNDSVVYSNYDPMGNAGRIVDGSSDLWFTYDVAGRILSVDAQASCGPLSVKSYSYGQANEGSNLVLGKLQTTSMTNYLDDLESICSGATKLLGDEIFSDGFESGDTSAWSFTLEGSESLSVTQTYVYAGLGGRLSDLISSVDGGVFTQTYTWSDLGELKTIVYPDLTGYIEPTKAISTLTYAYTNGFLTGVTGYAPSMTYHPNGTLSTITRENSGTDVFGLDPNGIPRARWLRGKKGGATLWYSGLYAYDGAGNVADIGSDTYVYDGLSRLLAGTAEGGTKTQSYSYDGFGNLSSITDSQGTRTITVSSTTNRLASPATYDAAGNLTSWGGYTYEWTPTGEMRTRTGTGLSKRFSYAADGERLVSEDLLTGTSTFSLRDPSGKVIRVFEKTGSTWSWQKDYVYRNGMLLATEDETETLFFTLDNLGTPRLVTDSNGDQVIQHAYFGFGEKADSTWDDEAMKFTGHERDLEGTPDTIDDLDYMHARYYNPSIGRFLSVDPVGGSVGSSQSWNRYTYVKNNPIRFVDPTGEISLDEYQSAQQKKDLAAKSAWQSFREFLRRFGKGYNITPNAVMMEGAGNSGPSEETVVRTIVTVETAAGVMDLLISQKTDAQLESHGWTEEQIQEIVENPDETYPAYDHRHRSDGTRNDDPATRYQKKDGSFVVVNDRTGGIVQVSNKNKPGYAPEDYRERP